MGFQTAVNALQGAGVPGELYTDGPFRAESFILTTTSHPEYNIIGATAFTISSQGVARAGGTGVYAGILVGPKQQASFGTAAGGPLAPTMTLANYVQADILSMGTIWATLPATAAIGDLVVFNTTTGVLTTIAPGSTLGAGTAFANAVVDYVSVTAAGLAVITVSPTLVIPQPA